MSAFTEIEAGQAALDEVAGHRKKDVAAFERLAARQAAENPAPEQDGDAATDAATDEARVPPPNGVDDERAIAALAALSLTAYDRVREGEAAKLGVRVATLDAEVKRRRAVDVNENADSGRAFTIEAPEPWEAPVDGASLLTDLAASVSQHVVLPKGAADAVALWVVHAHAHDAAQVSPLLMAGSPMPGCGKTTLLSWLGCVVPKPLPASNITTAALFRAVEKWGPTLLVDEADTFLGASDDLRGIINSGHARANAFVIRTVGEDHEPRAFSTWAPKAIAMIGRMHPTLASRSIAIELRRKGVGESAEPLRPTHHAGLDILRRKAARWAADNHTRLRHAEPVIPAGMANRGADNWLAVLAIADAAGGDWPDRARAAAVALGADRADESHAAVMLADLRTLFDTAKTDRLASVEIIATLTAMEDRPWPEWRDGRPLTARQLAKVLEPFGIRPIVLRDGRSVFKGYTRALFDDAFARYTPPLAVTRLQVNGDAGLRDSGSVTPNQRVTDEETPKRSTGAVCNRVTDPEPGTREVTATGSEGGAEAPRLYLVSRSVGSSAECGPVGGFAAKPTPPPSRPCTAAEYAKARGEL